MKGLPRFIWMLPLLVIGAMPASADLLVVLNKSDNKAALIDPNKRHKVVARLKTGKAPHEVAVTPDGHWAFVSNYGMSGVFNGKKKDEYKAVAKFLTFLSQPDVQAEFSQATGYLPITMAAYELTKKSGFYEKNPGTNVAVEQMIVKTTANSRGVRAGNFPQIRDVMDEELEAVWAGKKTAKQGMDDATKRGNEIIERFNKANRG